ncbi:g11615 [Coccomyxa elongata]
MVKSASRVSGTSEGASRQVQRNRLNTAAAKLYKKMFGGIAPEPAALQTVSVEEPSTVEQKPTSNRGQRSSPMKGAERTQCSTKKTAEDQKISESTEEAESSSQGDSVDSKSANVKSRVKRAFNPDNDCTVHLQYIPIWAILGLAIMVAGCATFALSAVKAGELLKTLVGLVGGSTSGFSAVVGAYVTTITATIAIAAVCTLLAIMMYAMRADQRLRQDLRYGAGERSLGIYKTYYWLTVFLFLIMFVMAAWFVCLVAVNTTASMMMGTLINGSDAGIAIITSAVAAANATLIRAHQAVDQVDAFANDWAQSPVGSIIGKLNGGNNPLNPYVNGNVNASSVAAQLFQGASAAGALASGNTAEQSSAANSLINTAKTLATQLAPTPVATPQSNFLNLPSINLPNLLGGGSSGGQQGPNLAALIPGNNQANQGSNMQQKAPPAGGNIFSNFLQAPSPPPPAAAGSAAQAPQTLSSLADQVLATIMPNEENVLQLAGLAAGGATTGRVPGQGQDANTGVVFGSGSHDNSVCPSLACLDVKMYNFLNSEACICTVQDLHTIRALSATAQAQLKITLIGLVLLYLGAAVLVARLSSEATMMYYERHILYGKRFDRLHERKVVRRQQLAEAELMSLRDQFDGRDKKASDDKRRADIRVEVPRADEGPAPCPPKTSPSLSPGKAAPVAAAQDV